MGAPHLAYEIAAREKLNIHIGPMDRSKRQPWRLPLQFCRGKAFADLDASSHG